MDVIQNIIDNIDTISLSQSGEVKFLKRCDYKYVLTLEKLTNILQSMNNEYYVLNINGHNQQEYKTVYFDTKDNYFYHCHHNGKNNRVKLRRREYISTGERFFEIKRKSLSGFATKKRITVNSELDAEINDTELNFIDKILGHKIENISPKMSTSFKRTTLVSKKMNERITIDIDLSFSDNHGIEASAGDLVIIEVKCNKHNGNTSIRKSLRANNIHSKGFSKYCIGRAILDENLKRNLFKNKIKHIG